MRRLVFACLTTALVGLAGRPDFAQSSQSPNPIVRMTVIAADGTTHQLTAPESGLAKMTLKDGTEIGVRPTILDSRPWARVELTFFRMPTSAHAAEEIGSVEVKTGAPVTQTKTSPAFKVAVTGVADD